MKDELVVGVVVPAVGGAPDPGSISDRAAAFDAKRRETARLIAERQAQQDAARELREHRDRLFQAATTIAPGLVGHTRWEEIARDAVELAQAIDALVNAVIA